LKPQNERGKTGFKILKQFLTENNHESYRLGEITPTYNEQKGVRCHLLYEPSKIIVAYQIIHKLNSQ